MTLGEFVKQYREEHKISVRYFANLSKMSPQQIINIERGIGNDGKPMSSTMKTYRKIAKAAGMNERDFMIMLNDNVIINPSDEKDPVTAADDGEDEAYIELRSIYQKLNEENRGSLRDYALYLLQRQKNG